MGLHAVVTFQLVGQIKLTWPQAITIVFVEGTLILLRVVTRFREAMMNAIPLSQKRATSTGIGMFIALIGFVNSGLVVQKKGTVAALGAPSSLRILVLLIGFVVMECLMIRGVPDARVIAILLASVAALVLNFVFGQGRPQPYCPHTVLAWVTDYGAKAPCSAFFAIPAATPCTSTVPQASARAAERASPLCSWGVLHQRHSAQSGR